MVSRWLLWLAVVGMFLPALTGAGRKERKTAAATPFPPPSDQGLFSVVQSLVNQVADITTKQSRDWSRLRRLERRGRSARNDIDIMHADIVQLRQHVTEINTRLDGLEDLTSDLQLQVTKLNTDQRRLPEEMGKLKRSRYQVDRRLDGLERNVTVTNSGVDAAHGQLRQVEMSLREIRKSHDNVVNKLETMNGRIHHLAVLEKSRHSSPQPQHQAVRDGHRDTVQQQLQRDQSQPPHQGRAHGFDGHQDRPKILTEETDISGDGEVRQYAGSGDGDEFFIVEERYLDPGSGETEIDGHHGHVTEIDFGVVTPTPLTTNTVPTLTQAFFTAPTSPTTPCPSVTEFSDLRQRVEDMETVLQTTRPTQDVLDLVANETERLEAAVTKREEALERVQSQMTDMGTTVSRLAGQLASLRLSEFMERLQVSLVNFTTNVLTLEKWHVASQQIMNATQRTQIRITDLGNRVIDNTQMTSDLQMTLRDYQVLSERQYRLLQTHVIRLNNSLQDLHEHVNNLAHQHSAPRRPLGQSAGPPGSGSASDQQGAVLTSRMDDLALQLVYSDNRLAHLETQLLNASLASCRKSNNDLYQDANLLRIDQNMLQAQRDVIVLKETVKRLDLGLYRLHSNAKAHQEVVRKVQGQVRDMTGVKATVRLLRKEVDNLLFQLPVDCSDYYQRGYRHSGTYVIYPRRAVHSIKVRCVMLTTDDAGDESDKQDNANDESDNNDKNKRNKARKGNRSEGGWTVIQQRNSGKVNFTRSWAEYAVGFGSTNSELWLGNENLHLLTQHRNYTLAITMRDIFGGHWIATYRRFALSDKEDNYRLALGRYQGNATDTMAYSSGMTFSTYDRDTDLSSSPCARYNGGGWWYSHCQISNLNGPYDIGMIWFQRKWRDWLQLREVVMVIKPSS